MFLFGWLGSGESNTLFIIIIFFVIKYHILFGS